MPTLAELKAAITKYVGKSDFNDLSYTISGTTVDTLTQAINNAKRLIQMKHDFEAGRCIGKLSFTAGSPATVHFARMESMTIVNDPIPTYTPWVTIGSVSSATGTSISISGSGTTLEVTPDDPLRLTDLLNERFTPDGVYPAGSTFINIVESISGFYADQVQIQRADIKRIEAAYVTDGFSPIELISREKWQARVKNFTGRDHTVAYVPQYPVIVQHGRVLYLHESEGDIADNSTFYFDVVRFIPDYGSDLSTDWFLTDAHEYLFWQGIVELNKLTKEFVPIEEGNLEEPVAKAQEAMETAIMRDIAYRKAMEERITGLPPGVTPTQPKGKK